MKIGIILGSGLNHFVDKISSPVIISEDKSGVHRKKILKGSFCNREIIIFSGRNHVYESGFDEKILRNIRIAGENNVDFIIITNAAGGINKNFKVGDLMVITSVINLFGKFLKSEMSEIRFDKKLINNVVSLSVRNNIPLKKGVYCASPGPMYESKSEIKFLKKIGADAVGMSTVPELYAASSSGVKILALSCITNTLSPASNEPVRHEDVLIAGKAVSEKLSAVISLIIKNLL